MTELAKTPLKVTYKVLQVAAVDATVKKLLMPLIRYMSSDGFDIHIACSNGQYVSEILAEGYNVHTMEVKRGISPLSNLKSLWRLYRLMKKERFDIVHVHTPVAAALGRIAAWAARVPVIIYTAHGFYFHERMASWLRRLMIWIEWCLCHFCDLVLTQSNEDAQTAINEHICSNEKVIWIGNGVNTNQFGKNTAYEDIRSNLGLSSDDKVIGYVGRIVNEKGVVELITAMKYVIEAVPEAKLVMVGDTLDSDRDKNIKVAIRNLLSENNLSSHVIFTGFREDIPAVMNMIDLFVLPSYREGMPRSVLEAMASGKPVVATNIRGSREEVVPDVTGLLVPPGDVKALAGAIIKILENPMRIQQMGAAGEQRARISFDENMVLVRQKKAYDKMIQEKITNNTSSLPAIKRKHIQLFLKRALDISASLSSLLVLVIPFIVISLFIKIDSKGPIFFKQERVGKDGKNFFIWKFRTMINGAINHGLGLNVAKNDPRITRIGVILRNLGIDELPQLINVFLGDMSLVGPRPTLRNQVDLYGNFERQRLSAKPGMTCLSIIKGRNRLSWNERIELDVEYIKTWSLWLDIKIIIKTFWVVLVKREGIYGPEGINDDFHPSLVEQRATMK